MYACMYRVSYRIFLKGGGELVATFGRLEMSRVPFEQVLDELN